MIPLAAAVKEQVKIPILCGGRMNDPALAAQAIAEGRWTGWSWAGPPLADPDFPGRWPWDVPRRSAPASGRNQGVHRGLEDRPPHRSP